MNSFKIFDKSIYFVGKKAKKINDVGVVVYYFNRLTRTSMLPIEVTAIELKDDILFFSPQLHNYTLDSDDLSASYMNSIIFYKDAVRNELKSIQNKEVPNYTVSVFKEIFDIDLSAIDGIDGLVFDRIIYTEGFRIKNTELVADGYVFVFTDAAQRRAKLGFFAGNIRNKKLDEFVADMNEYGASNILNNITIEQNGNKVTVSNNTPFHVEIQPYLTTYNVTPKEYGERIYKRVKNPTSMLILRPNESFTFTTDNPQKAMTYNLLNNVIANGYVDDEFSNLSETYQEQKDYIKYQPIEFELKRVGLEPNITHDIENFFLITGFNTIDKLDDTEYLIAHKNSSNASINSDLGTLSVNTEKLSYNVTKTGMKEAIIKGFANTALIRLDSEQFAIDYSFNESETFITEIAYKNIFNNVISEYVPALSISTATIADYNEFEYQNTKIKVEKTLIGERQKNDVLPYIMKSDLFKDEVLMIDLNEISEMNSRPPFGHYIFKSFVKELDDVIEEYYTKRKQAVSNFKFLDIPLEVSTRDISEFAPKSKIWDITTKEHNNFVYRVKEHLADLGYEIALEEALKRLKTALYVFTPVKNIIATNTFGISLDHKWYFMGSNWYRAEEIENPKITTYVNDKIKEFNIESGDYKFMYVKKTFFGYSNDTNEEISYAKAFAACIGTNTPIPSDLLIENPALMYIMEHTIDNERYYTDFNELVTYPADFVNKYTEKNIRNKYVFPNIFKKEYNTKFYPGLYSSARRNELERVISNNALDVLDSIQKIQISTSAFLCFDDKPMKELTKLFSSNAYHILGISDAKYNANDVVKFKLSIPRNTIINGYAYDYGMEIYLNGERRFGLYYNITTKKTYMFLADEVVVTDYSLMISIFDAMLLYNVDEINGYTYKDVGVFSAGVDGIEDKYLYLPIENPVESNYELFGISVNYIDKSFFLRIDTDEVISMNYNLGEIITDNNSKAVNIKIGAKIDRNSNELVLIKDESEIRVPLVSLKNLPSKTITYNGFVIKPYRVGKFMPAIYSNQYLRSLLIKVNYNNHDYYLTLEYGKYQWIEDKGSKILFALDDKGISYGINTGNHMSDLKTIYSLNDIFTNNFDKDTELPFEVTVLEIEGGLL